MKKFLKITLIILISYYVYFFLKNIVIWKEIFTNTINLWLFKVVVGIIPMYVLSSLLIGVGFINNFLFKIINKFKLFENKKAFDLFIVSFLCGTPTTSIITKESYLKNEITYKQASNIINNCSFISFLFLSMMLERKMFFIISSSQIIASISMYICTNHNVTKYNNAESTNYPIINIINTIIDELPIILLKILITMLLVSVIITPFHKYSHFLNIFEVTIGLNNVINNNYNVYINIVLINSLLSLNGIAIILQVYNVIKKTRLNFKHFLIGRLIPAIISVFLSLIILFIINFFS